MLWAVAPRGSLGSLPCAHVIPQWELRSVGSRKGVWRFREVAVGWWSFPQPWQTHPGLEHKPALRAGPGGRGCRGRTELAAGSSRNGNSGSPVHVLSLNLQWPISGITCPMSEQRKIWRLKNTDCTSPLCKKPVSSDDSSLLVVVTCPLNSVLLIRWRAEFTTMLISCWYRSCCGTRSLTKRLSREWTKNLHRIWISLPEIKRLQGFYLNGIIRYFRNGM